MMSGALIINSLKLFCFAFSSLYNWAREIESVCLFISYLLCMHSMENMTFFKRCDTGRQKYWSHFPIYFARIHTTRAKPLHLDGEMFDEKSCIIIVDVR